MTRNCYMTKIDVYYGYDRLYIVWYTFNQSIKVFKNFPEEVFVYFIFAKRSLLPLLNPFGPLML